MKAKAKKSKKKGEMSKTEKLWEKEGVQIVINRMQVENKLAGFEPVTFRILGISYTPDFMHQLENGEILFVEVKASTYQRGYAYSMSRLKTVSNGFPMFHFARALKTKTGWNFRLLQN